MSAEEIDFDVDLRELQGQPGVDVLCNFLAAIGSELGKPVMMTSEGGSPAHPVLGFDPALNLGGRTRGSGGPQWRLRAAGN